MKYIRLLLLLIIGAIPALAQYPSNYEVLCPQGQTPISGPTGSTYDQATQLYRAIMCIDPFGNVIFQGTLGTGSTTGFGAVINPKQFGVVANTQWVCDATFVNNSKTVTTPLDRGGFTGADVGKIVWGSNSECGGEVQPSQTTIVPQGVITGITDAHTAQVSIAANANCTPVQSDGCVLVWGNDDTVAMQNSFTAAVQACGVLLLPPGGMIIQSAIVYNGLIKCPEMQAGNGAGSGYAVLGFGNFSSVVLPSPTFNAATCLAGNSGCFFANIPTGSQGVNYQTYHDFGMAAFSTVPAGMSGQVGFRLFNEALFFNMNLFDLWPGGNWTVVSAIGVVNSITNIHDNTFLNAGNTAISASAYTNIFANQVQGSFTQLSVVGPNIHSWGNQFNLGNTIQQITVTGTGELFSSDDTVTCQGAPTLNCIDISVSTASATFEALKLSAAGPGLRCVGTCSIVGRASKVTATGNHIGITNSGTLTLQNVTVSGTGSNCISNSGTLINAGGLSCPAGTFNNTGTAFAASVSESGSGTCAASTATITFKGVYLNNPLVSISDTTTTGGARISAKTLTTATVTCTGATDSFDYAISANPI